MGVLRIFEIFSYFSMKTCCDPSLEPSQQGGSNEGTTHILKELYGKLSLNYPFCLFLSRALLDPILMVALGLGIFLLNCLNDIFYFSSDLQR